MVILCQGVGDLFPFRNMIIHNVYSSKVASSVMASALPTTIQGLEAEESLKIFYRSVKIVIQQIWNVMPTQTN